MADNTPYVQALGVLPPRLRACALALDDAQRGRVEEIRLRAGQPPCVVFPWGEEALDGAAVTVTELEQVLELASRSSIHTVMEQLRRGYLTLPGGHRLGLCGTAAVKDGAVYTLRRISSANLRIARALPNVGREVLAQLAPEGELASTLILAPPGLGKTTLLRDLIRAISAGEGLRPHRVGLADERGEVAALWEGVAQLDVGPRTDVLEGCAKAQGLMLLLRAMNPQVLAADEITAPEDVEALSQATGCGVKLLCTAHGAGREDLLRRPLYRRLFDARVFSRLVCIERQGDARNYRVEVLE